MPRRFCRVRFVNSTGPLHTESAAKVNAMQFQSPASSEYRGRGGVQALRARGLSRAPPQPARSSRPGAHCSLGTESAEGSLAGSRPPVRAAREPRPPARPRQRRGRQRPQPPLGTGEGGPGPETVARPRRRKGRGAPKTRSGSCPLGTLICPLEAGKPRAGGWSAPLRPHEPARARDP